MTDGLLVGAIAFLVGLTLLVWCAAGLSGLLAEGAWPRNVTFLRAPVALRQLVSDPQDLPAAWPDTPEEELSGYGLFWGVLIGELMVLTVLGVFTVGTLARYRMVRERGRRERGEATVRSEGPARRPEPNPAGASDALPVPEEFVFGSGATNGGGGEVGRTPRHPAAGPRHPAVPRTAHTTGGVRSSSAPAGPPGPVVGSDGRGDGSDAQSAATASAGNPSVLGPADTTGTPAGSTGSRPGDGDGDGSWPVGPVPGPRPSHFPARELSLPRIVYGTDRGDAATRTILDADGPVLVVTSSPDVWETSRGARQGSGPVHVFDPSHLLDTPSRLRWNPASGCESREVAAVRAAALLAPVRPGHALDRPTADAAETLLRCWLHAAAVSGRPFRQVHRWAQGGAAHEPVRILRTHPKAAGGAAGELEATLTAYPQRRDQALELTARALAALSSIHIRDACSPGRADVLALESFIGEGGTLYLVGESIEDPRAHPGAMPLLTALASSVVEHGRRMAERSSAGRLDPPLTLVLDDIAAVAPFPALPELIAQGAAHGILTLALMRSQEQARARWPHRALVR